MTQGFIFDLDGTLADTMPGHHWAWRMTAKRYGFSFDEDRFYALGGVPTRKIAAILLDEAGLDLDPIAVAGEKEQLFADHLDDPGFAVPIEPVIEIASQRRRDGRLAVASGGTRPLVVRTLEGLGIRDWFAAIVTAEDTTLHKPEPDVFLLAAKRLGIGPAGCTVYEDTDIGIEAATRAGMQWVDVRALYPRRRIPA